MKSLAAGVMKKKINQARRITLKKKKERVFDPEEINQLNLKFDEKWCGFNRNVSNDYIDGCLVELATAAIQYYNTPHETRYALSSVMHDGIEDSFTNSPDEQGFVIVFKANWLLPEQYTFRAKVFVCRPFGNLKVKYCDLLDPKPCYCLCHISSCTINPDEM